MPLESLRSLSPSRRRQLGDVAAVTAALALAVVGLALDIEDRGTGVELEDIAVIGAACLALLWRRRFPWAVLVGVVVARVGLIALTGAEAALIPAEAIALYHAARTGNRRVVLSLALVAAVATTTVILNVDQDEPAVLEFLSELATALVPVVLADAVRSREERVAAVVEAEAVARVQEERLRIARDLHDVVAHALATISVQSGVAAYNLPDDDPDDPVRVALERINESGKRSLEDLRTMVGVLRSTDEAPLRPTPTDPDDLTPLSEAASLAGIELSVRQAGAFPDDAHDAAVVAVHRIAQEALTNVARHAGPVPAVLELEHSDGHVRLRVVNETTLRSAPEGGTTGVGIVGMRERAESLGGTLTTQALVGGGFEVLATIPYQRRSS